MELIAIVAALHMLQKVKNPVMGKNEKSEFNVCSHLCVTSCHNDVVKYV